MFDRHIFVIHFCPGTLTANICMYIKGKIKHSGTGRKSFEIAFWGENKNLLIIQIHLETFQ